MSAFPVFSPAAMGRPFIFSPLSSPCPAEETAKKKPATAAEILAQVGAVCKLSAVVPASCLDVRPAPEMVPSGIPQLDALTGGIARGCLTEICGTASSGRTSVLLSALAHATQRGEVCALVDGSDAFDPASAAAAGMKLGRLLWVRCGTTVPSSRFSVRSLLPERNFENSTQRRFNAARGVSESRLEQVLKVTDLLLQSNGFGMIALDLGDVPVRSARRIPLASWFRFRRAIEHTSTALLVLEQQPIAGSCSSVLIKVSGLRWQAPGNQLSHAELLDQIEITAELLRSRLEIRKSGQSTANFKSRAAWAG
jgi:recombination protein RecA